MLKQKLERIFNLGYVIVFTSVFLLSSIFAISPNQASAQAGTLPAASHSMVFGYYFALGQYGNYINEVKDYNNTTIILAESWIRPTDGTNDTAGLDSAFSAAVAAGQRIIYKPVDPSQTTYFNSSMNVASRYWNSVDYVYAFDEPSLDKASLQSYIDSLNTGLSQAGVSSKPIFVNFTSNQILNGDSWQATNIDVVGIEAYVDPSQQNSNTLSATLTNQLNSEKSRIGNKQMFIVVQGYNRNGTWTNLNTLQQIQTIPYQNSYNDPNVLGLLVFSYARSGGTKDLGSCISTEHKRIFGAITGASQPATVACSGGSSSGGTPAAVSGPVAAEPGWFSDLAFDSRNNVWLSASFDQSSGDILARRLDKDLNPIGGVFTINSADQTGVGTPLVAYSPDASEFLVIWYVYTSHASYESDYARFVYPDGTMSPPFELNRQNPILSAGADKASDLQYDARNRKFVFVSDGLGDQIYPLSMMTINLDGTIANRVDISDVANKGYWNPKVAVNNDRNEYCAVFDLREVGKWGVIKYSDSPLQNMDVHIVDALSLNTDIAYNPKTQKYLVIYEDKNFTTHGRIMDACDPTDSVDFVIGPSVGHPRVAANSFNGYFGIIGVDCCDNSDAYAIVDSTGSIISRGLLTTPSRNGEFVPIIAADNNRGYFGAAVDHDFEETVMWLIKPPGSSGGVSSTTTQVAINGLGGAYNTSTDTVLIISGDNVNGDNQIVGQIINAQTQTAVGSSFQIDQGGAQTYSGSPQASFDAAASTYLVTWNDSRPSGSDSHIYARLVSADGTMSGNDFVVVGDKSATLSDLSFNSSNNKFVIAYDAPSSDGNTVYIKTVDATGAVGSEAVLNAPANTFLIKPSVAYNSGLNQYWVTVSSCSKTDLDLCSVYLYQLDASSLTPVGQPKQITQPGVVRSSSVEYSPPDSTALLVWWDGNNSGSVYAVSIDNTGKISDPVPILTTAQSPQSASFGIPQLTFNPKLNTFTITATDNNGNIVMTETDSKGQTLQTRQPVSTQNANNPINNAASVTTNSGNIILSVQNSQIVVTNQQGQTKPIATNLDIGPIGLAVSRLYIWSLGAAAILALLMVIIGGYYWMTAAGNASRVTKGKEIIFAALLGLALLFAAYIILNTINPDLVDFSGPMIY